MIEDDDKISINKGVELMLRQKTKTGEENQHFRFNFSKMISLFNREFHFDFNFSIIRKNSRR
jgi:hypothetical protein